MFLFVYQRRPPPPKKKTTSFDLAFSCWFQSFIKRRFGFQNFGEFEQTARNLETQTKLLTVTTHQKLRLSTTNIFCLLLKRFRCPLSPHGPCSKTRIELWLHFQSLFRTLWIPPKFRTFTLRERKREAKIERNASKPYRFVSLDGRVKKRRKQSVWLRQCGVGGAGWRQKRRYWRRCWLELSWLDPFKLNFWYFIRTRRVEWGSRGCGALFVAPWRQRARSVLSLAEETNERRASKLSVATRKFTTSR